MSRRVLFPAPEPDVEALFEFNGVRKYPIFDGYRPAHLITENYLTTGLHHYYDAPEIPADGTARGTITFISPEAYPHCLWVGRKIPFQDGARIVGYATILKVMNPLLLAEPDDCQILS